jgi:hypothetical protein
LRSVPRPVSALLKLLFVAIIIAVVVVVIGAVVPGFTPEILILNIAAEMGFGDKVALNPAAESYLNQAWGGQTINLPAEGTSELCYKDKYGHDTYVIYYNDTDATVTNQQNVHNPTMAELKAFLNEDQTERYVYSKPSFVCTNFAVILHDNAEAKGIRCAFVAIQGTGSSHALDAFQTTDDGLIFVDDTGTTTGFGVDKLAKITMGSEVSEVAVFRSGFFVQGSSQWSDLGSIISGEMWW